MQPRAPYAIVPAMTTHFDLPIAELRAYRPELAVPSDLQQFWQATLSEAESYPLDATFTAYDSPLRTVEVFDVRFSGYAGQRVSAWLLLPRDRSTPLPCIVQYVGYGGGRGLPHEWLTWSALGYAHLVMDTRGQGSDHHAGDTPDHDRLGAPPHVPGFLTRGLPDPARYYYRRLFTDAVRAVEAVTAHPEVDGARIVTAGSSQGGALSLAVSILRGWLLEDPVAAVLADVPFLCHFRRAAELAADDPYTELVRWLSTHRDAAEQAFAALAYFDIAVLAPQAVSPSLWSVGIRDAVCPPSTVFAAHNRYGGPADLRVWEWNEHEGGEAFQVLEQTRWLDQHLGTGPPAA
ncbi:MAG: cephalosporin-C deacetylase [Actinomycetota bacterium]|jgi:cephalosporin-C deacetylase|nr:cephalosporin-C deacetylase [Actinomycetota bacterium]